jgi:hypothetical protein
MRTGSRHRFPKSLPFRHDIHNAYGGDATGWPNAAGGLQSEAYTTGPCAAAQPRRSVCASVPDPRSRTSAVVGLFVYFDDGTGFLPLILGG